MVFPQNSHSGPGALNYQGLGGFVLIELIGTPSATLQEMADFPVREKFRKGIDS